MEAEEKIRVLIAEDYRLFREGLRLILNAEKSIEIVGEASNGLQAINASSELQPDIVLLDITMRELDGIQAIPAIQQKSPRTKALMLTRSMDEGAIFKALQAGAKGYLSKNTSVSNLMKAIKGVQRGELWIERKLMAKFFDGENAASFNVHDRQEKAKQSLTTREQEVLQQLVKGSTNKEIAQALFISEKTIKSHLNSIFRKLNVSRRLHAILYAIGQGLV